MKTLHERIPLAGFSKLPSIPQIAKVNCLAWLELQQRLCQAALGSSAWALRSRGTWVVLWLALLLVSCKESTWLSFGTEGPGTWLAASSAGASQATGHPNERV